MLPVKMLEYVALGIPVIVPRLKAIEFYFDDEMVSYFEAEDVDSLADRILELYMDESRRKSQVQKAKRFLEKYGWPRHQHELLEVYKQLHQHGKHSANFA
jgi:glycosyltransferase involved in cell wall biosynthesis